jgi:Tannase and feruloyl esterase
LRRVPGGRTIRGGQRREDSNARANSRSAKLAATSHAPIPGRLSNCGEIANLTDLAANPQYPTAIASSDDVRAGNGNPEFCDVKGMIAPQTHFELELPVHSWQGRYLQNGCGGYCGTVSTQTFPSCDATLGGDFAMATDDEGHVTAAGLGGGGLFAFNDQKLRNEYGYESEQALYVVAREIMKDYYGVYPNEDYYNGCSDGGREAMEMAERYPDDFNGIIAGAPEIIAGPLNAENQTWDVRVNTGADGNAILTADKLPAVHAAVIAACGNDDGVFPAANTWDAMLTDLRAFRRHGGKLIMWQGWADNGIPPSGTVDYYDTLTARNGGQASTESFARLFMYPSILDMIYPMVQWVEQGISPDQLQISYTVNGNSFSRPVYPYPEIPKYNGSGDPSSALSFHAVTSPGAHYTNWYGNYLFFEPVGGGGSDRGYTRRG